MPLPWILSNLTLLIILFVFCSVFGSGYYSLFKISNLSGGKDLFMFMWW